MKMKIRKENNKKLSPLLVILTYRRNYVWSINTLTFFIQLPNTKNY